MHRARLSVLVLSVGGVRVLVSLTLLFQVMSHSSSTGDEQKVAFYATCVDRGMLSRAEACQKNKLNERKPTAAHKQAGQEVQKALSAIVL